MSDKNFSNWSIAVFAIAIIALTYCTKDEIPRPAPQHNTNYVMRIISFKKGERKPVGSDNRWLKKQIRNAKTDYISVGFRFTERSRYAIKNVGGDNDQNDWMKMGGTMSIANVFNKQAEELAAFRYNDKGEFQICRYVRSKATGGSHRQYNIQTCKLNQWYFVRIEKKYCLTVGAWAGGDGILLNDFEVDVNVLG